jgi:AraC-like DNA-binding protein
VQSRTYSSLPIDFGSRTKFEHLGVFGLAIRTAGTMAQAIEHTLRFQRLFTNSGTIHIERHRDAVFWGWARKGQRSVGLRLANEAALVEQVALIRQLVPGATPVRVSFRHPAPCAVDAHRRYLGCPVEWSATEEGVRWPTTVFDRAMPHVDPALSRYFSDEAAKKLDKLGNETLAARATSIISRQLMSDEVSLQAVARGLALTPRRLRSGLSAENTSLRTLVDAARQDGAQALVDAGEHSMTEIAFLLGFSETSAFSRAWRRWFGAAPRVSRRSTSRATRSSRGDE